MKTRNGNTEINPTIWLKDGTAVCFEPLRSGSINLCIYDVNNRGNAKEIELDIEKQRQIIDAIITCRERI